MVLQGAEVLLYPTAIGSEPPDPSWDSSRHWQRVMQGHAGANLCPVVAANRIGHEAGETTEITFYGTSFITDATGAVVAEANRTDEAILVAEFDRTYALTMRTCLQLACSLLLTYTFFRLLVGLHCEFSECLGDGLSLC